MEYFAHAPHRSCEVHTATQLSQIIKKKLLNKILLSDASCLCCAAHSVLSLSSGHRSKKAKQQKGRTETKVQQSASVYVCHGINSNPIIAMSKSHIYYPTPPPCGYVCNVSKSKDSLTCFTVKAMEGLWEVQTLNLFLEKFNICGVYFSCPC